MPSVRLPQAAARLAFSALALTLPAAVASSAPAADNVDIALVIVTDVSYSVDDNEAQFQRQGAVAAFRNPEVVKAIQSGPLGRIAVAYLDFASYGAGRIVANWQVVHDKASADVFADALAVSPRTNGVQTSISNGIEMAMDLLDKVPYRATKRVIDVSGDGPNNDGRRVDQVREDAVAKGITINGLPIQTEADKTDFYYIPDLDKYYRGCVIGGPTAFIQVAKGFEDLERAIRRKLILEISQAAPDGEPRLVKVAAAGGPSHEHYVFERGCDIGERMRFGLR